MIDWMRSSIIPFTFAMVIMPATMVSILPIGGLLARSGRLAAPDFIYIIILAVGLITPLVTCMSYSDDIRTMGTIIGEVRRIVQQGRHEELMKQEGIYRNYVSERREAAGWKVRNA